MEKRQAWVLVSFALSAGSIYLFTLDGALAKGSAIWLLGFGLAALRRSRPTSTDSAGYSMGNHWLVVMIFAGLSIGLAALFLRGAGPIRYVWLFGALCTLFAVAVLIWSGLKMQSGTKPGAVRPD